MKLTIDNLDGAGAIDYSAALSAPLGSGETPLKIERVLNTPSRCTLTLDLSANGLPMPVRRGRIVVTSERGATLFTGYLATEPVRIYVGVATEGHVYRIAITAVSDAASLDKQPMPSFGTTLLGTGAVMLPLAGSTTGNVIHTLNDGDGTLALTALQMTNAREVANDVTLSGEIEATTYIAETFNGDGTTAAFQLSETPFHPKNAVSATSSTVLLSDSFETGVLNQNIWKASDPGSRLSFSGSGFTVQGGIGYDGQTTLTALDAVELGGSLVIEAASVQLTAPSDGVICGLYRGPTARANCFAGYNVRTSGSSVLVVPYVNGVEVGTAYTIQQGHKYTLRIRVYSPEAERILQTYYAMVDGALVAFGGGENGSPVSLVFDLQDLGVSSNTPATVLYDGSVNVSPGFCTFVAVDSIQLTGSMRSFSITQEGSAWITSILPSGVKRTRLFGSTGEGVDCQLSTTGKLTFFDGRIPVAGERVTVTYRACSRAVARLEDAASVNAAKSRGYAGTASVRWLGKVVQPIARSSVDCESAAQAVLSFAASSSCAIAGTYSMMNPAVDIQPRDILSITTGDTVLEGIVRKVDVVDTLSAPEVLNYKITFASGWAEAMGMKLSEPVAADAQIPVTASDTISGPGTLTNLQQLQIVSATATVLQIDAGMDPPAGGGFEVRRTDFGFGSSTSPDFVLRSPVRGFAIPRTAQVERYYVRMYDNSAPAKYSRFSSAIFVCLPV
ncbi:MAG: hypothetical protein FWD64_07640 [Acidobacteriaceae bacterium]|nr:hypothetical protein [Acidobacteriaceae bacterium]